MSPASPESTDGPVSPASPVTRPLEVPSQRIALVGVLLWVVALVVVLAVPALRTGERAWWPWSSVAGIVLGTLGWLYLRRGRGNVAQSAGSRSTR